MVEHFGGRNIPSITSTIGLQPARKGIPTFYEPVQIVKLALSPKTYLVLHTWYGENIQFIVRTWSNGPFWAPAAVAANDPANRRPSLRTCEYSTLQTGATLLPLEREKKRKQSYR